MFCIPDIQVRYWLLGTLLYLGCTSLASAVETQQRPLRLGLSPFLTPSVLIKQFAPLTDYLATRLGRRVQACTAPDYKTYIRRIERGEFDVFLTSPHIAAYLEQTRAARRLARFDRNLTGYFVVRRTSALNRLAQLRGRGLAMPDRLAAVTFLGESTLRAHQLDPRHDIIVRHTTHNNALQLVAAGLEDAGLVAIASYENAPEQLRAQLRVLAKTYVIPNMMFHSRADLPEHEYNKIKRAMLGFTAQGAGKPFFSHAAFGDMAPISDFDIGRLQLLSEQLEERMQLLSPERISGND